MIDRQNLIRANGGYERHGTSVVITIEFETEEAAQHYYDGLMELQNAGNGTLIDIFAGHDEATVSECP